MRAHEKGLVENEHQQLALDRIRARWAEGPSLRQSAAVLDAEGHRARTSTNWQSAVSSRILERERAIFVFPSISRVNAPERAICVCGRRGQGECGGRCTPFGVFLIGVSQRPYGW
jgi:hypothetical protein